MVVRKYQHQRKRGKTNSLELALPILFGEEEKTREKADPLLAGGSVSRGRLTVRCHDDEFIQRGDGGQLLRRSAGRKTQEHTSAGDQRRDVRPRSQQQRQPLFPGASNLSTGFILFNAFVGTGILAFPFAFKCAGILGGFGGLVLIGFVSNYTTRLLISCKEFCNQTEARVILTPTPRRPRDAAGRMAGPGQIEPNSRGTLQQAFLDGSALSASNESWRAFDDTVGLPIVETYIDLAGHVFGLNGKRVITFTFLTAQLGFCTVYAIFMLENLKHWLRPSSKWTLMLYCYPLLWTLMLYCYPLFLVLALVPDTTLLVPLSKLGSLAVLVAASLICYAAKIDEVQSAFVNAPLINLAELPLFFGIASFSFAVHGVVLPVQSRMRHPDDFSSVLDVVMLGSGLLFGLVGMVGFVTFGNETEGDVTNNLEQVLDHSLVLALKAALLVALLGIYPLMLFPVTEAFDPSPDQPYTLWPRLAWFLIRVLFVAFTCIIGEVMPFFGLVTSLLGALSVSVIVFIFPVVTHLRLRWDVMSCAWRVMDILVLVVVVVVGRDELCMACHGHLGCLSRDVMSCAWRVMDILGRDELCMACDGHLGCLSRDVMSCAWRVMDILGRDELCMACDGHLGCLSRDVMSCAWRVMDILVLVLGGVCMIGGWIMAIGNLVSCLKDPTTAGCQ
eukprot:g5699.t1